MVSGLVESDQGGGGGVVERVMATYRIDGRRVDVVEELEDEGAWYRLVVDGVVRGEPMPIPPDRAELERRMTARPPDS